MIASPASSSCLRSHFVISLMPGKDNVAYVDDSLRINHLVVCCEVGLLTFRVRL